MRRFARFGKSRKFLLARWPSTDLLDLHAYNSTGPTSLDGIHLADEAGELFHPSELGYVPVEENNCFVADWSIDAKQVD